MPCSSTYCISNTGLVGADDNYITGGTYNGDTYWSGQTSGWTIYFYTGTTSYWCLSDTLGGPCYLTGKYPCVSTCPDLSNVYVFSGICLTPTPTPTQNCDVLDFTALFDCDYVPTPTPSPSVSVTPTQTVTPSSTNFCSIVGIDASGYTYTPTPTPTPTVTPTMYDNNSLRNRLPFYSPLIERNCPITGFIEYSPIVGEIICPGAMKWQDCYNSSTYYYSNSVTGIPPETDLIPFMIFGANIDNQPKCISYLGMDYDHGNENSILITTGPWGYSSLGDCIYCQTNIVSDPICFYFESEAVGSGTWNCTITNSGLYNNKPYYVVPQDDCVTSLGVYIWWNEIQNRWELTDSLGNSSNLFGYNNNPNSYPLSNTTYSWVDVELTIKINSSVLGNCPTPTPTPTMTSTPTPTPTPNPSPSPTTTPTNTPTTTVTPSSTSPASIACNGSLTTNGQVGYYEINTDIGTGLGLTYLNCFAGDIPDRFQIYWNNTLVADSLFVGNYLNVNGTTRDNYVNGILGTTSYTKFIYVGSGGNAPGNNQWNTNGTISVSFNSNDIAPNTSTRASGSVGNQINVSPSYLLPTDKSCDGDVQLFFNKTSASPTTIKIIVMGGRSGSGGGTTGWSIKNLICPSSAL
jgi:hypothetical protein